MSQTYNILFLEIILSSKVTSTECWLTWLVLCIAWVNFITWLVIFSLKPAHWTEQWATGEPAHLVASAAPAPERCSACSHLAIVTAPLTHHITALCPTTHTSYYVTKNILQTMYFLIPCCNDKHTHIRDRSTISLMLQLLPKLFILDLCWWARGGKIKVLVIIFANNAVFDRSN